MGELEPRQYGFDRIQPAPDRERKDTAKTLHLAGGHCVPRMRLQAGVEHPFDRRVSFEMAGDRHCVVVLALNPQVQGLHGALQ